MMMRVPIPMYMLPPGLVWCERTLSSGGDARYPSTQVIGRPVGRRSASSSSCSYQREK